MSINVFQENAKFVREFLSVIGYDVSALARYGFDAVRVERGSISHIYKHEGLGVVVKRPYLTGSARNLWNDNRKRFFPEAAVETVVEEAQSLSIARNEGALIFIQPIVDTSRAKEAYDFLFDEGTDSGDDLAERNCGFYKDKAVVFDW